MKFDGILMDNYLKNEKMRRRRAANSTPKCWGTNMHKINNTEKEVNPFDRQPFETQYVDEVRTIGHPKTLLERRISKTSFTLSRINSWHSTAQFYSFEI